MHAELQGLAEHIDPDDVELLEWDGVPEFPDDEEVTTMSTDAPYFSTGKVDGTLGPIRHASMEDAEAWIAAREKVDPAGVDAGAYYIDAPEDYQAAAGGSGEENAS